MTGRVSDEGTSDPPSARVTVIGAAAVDEWYAVSNLPAVDGGAYADEVVTAPGGVGGNVAVALDRLRERDREVALVSRVGDDEYGTAAVDALAETGVETSLITVGEAPTTRSLVLRAPNGDRAIVTTGESFRTLRLDDTMLDVVADSGVVFLTAYAPDTVARAVFDRLLAGDRSVDDADPDRPAVVFDLSGPVSELVGRGTRPPTIQRYARRADLFVAGEVAAAAYFGGVDAAIERLSTARAARPSVSGPAVLTHGANGATVVTSETTTQVDAFEVETVDTTGAGDAFVAGLMDRWLLDGGTGSGETRTTCNTHPSGTGTCGPASTPEPAQDQDSEPNQELNVKRFLDAVRFASAAAAINCTGRFARSGLPTRAAVRQFLTERADDERSSR